MIVAHLQDLHQTKQEFVEQTAELKNQHLEALLEKQLAISKIKEDYQTRRDYLKKQLDETQQYLTNLKLKLGQKILFFQQKINQQGQDIKVLTTENAQLFSQVKDLKTQLHAKVLECQKLDILLSDTQRKLKEESEALRLLRVEHAKVLKSHNDERQKT